MCKRRAGKSTMAFIETNYNTNLGACYGRSRRMPSHPPAQVHRDGGNNGERTI